ncbi:MAG: glycoside hydrolase family 1 protein [Chloroflexi bacterium]|nr:MAG: glycoside hydrolase family 1 protein [Chloroflexota bacterium]MBL1195724.1 glycoside hydrolase family 1 protein [Chloroflexota bacterium]NOH13012.1 glycoside hydrolase family 1 protein [Chloroflexota bacterium]
MKPSAIYQFPRGFLWGTATSSHQVEGNNSNNNWSAWEQTPGKILNGDRSGLACDWWGGRWREDFDRAKESGQNAHRLSIEWSRIQPSPDRWDEEALDHYRQMIRGLVERGMTPLVTLHHFTDPLWVTEMGGWENGKTPELFEVYARRVVEALKEYVTLWITINEPNVLATMGYVIGDFPPGTPDMSLAFQVMANLARGHARAYHAIHEVKPEARVGIAVNYRGFQPKRSWWPFDRLVAWYSHRLFNEFFPQAFITGELKYIFRKVSLPQAKGTQDFLGLNYYTDELVAFDITKASEGFAARSFPPDADLSPTGFIANLPDAFFTSLKWARKLQMPIIITENGVEDQSDEMRPRYLANHIHQLWQAVNFSYGVKGYFHWSLVDNFEWDRGWSQRFGLWGLDVDTQTRQRRKSVDFYEAICKANGLSTEMVSEYAPEAFDSIFPT